MDIIVTTPKSQMDTAAQEAENVKASGGGFYFRNLGQHCPRDLEEGDRIFYVEDGFVRGFAIITWVTETPGLVCDTTGRQFGPGWYAISDAESWKWIRPIPMQGFQGWRYFDALDSLEVIGDWLDPKPAVTAAVRNGR